jgi:hypothetical protein
MLSIQISVVLKKNRNENFDIRAFFKYQKHNFEKLSIVMHNKIALPFRHMPQTPKLVHKKDIQDRPD